MTSKTCPHYWIDGVNLFEEFTTDDINRLTRVLTNIRQRPVRYLNSRVLLLNDCCRCGFTNELDALDRSIVRHVIGQDGWIDREC